MSQAAFWPAISDAGSAALDWVNRLMLRGQQALLAIFCATAKETAVAGKIVRATYGQVDPVDHEPSNQRRTRPVETAKRGDLLNIPSDAPIRRRAWAT